MGEKTEEGGSLMAGLVADVALLSGSRLKILRIPKKEGDYILKDRWGKVSVFNSLGNLRWKTGQVRSVAPGHFDKGVGRARVVRVGGFGGWWLLRVEVL